MHLVGNMYEAAAQQLEKNSIVCERPNELHNRTGVKLRCPKFACEYIKNVDVDLMNSQELALKLKAFLVCSATKLSA